MYCAVVRARLLPRAQAACHKARRNATSSRNFSGTSLTRNVEQFSELAANSGYAEDMYEAWLKDPKVVHQSWNDYFSQTRHVPRSVGGRPAAAGVSIPEISDPRTVERSVRDHMAVQALIRSYQVNGHRIANIDPLDLEPRRSEIVIPELGLEYHGLSEEHLDRVFSLPFITHIGGSEPALPLREIITRLRKIYCGSIGVQYMYMPKREHCEWIRRRFETPGVTEITQQERKSILQRLLKADRLEDFLRLKWPAEKRFGLEGCEALIPGIQAVIDTSSALGVDSVIIGMPHRGRLNVIANVCHKPMKQVFTQFKGLGMADEGSGDVKYHLGLSHEVINEVTGQPVRLTLCANPSHLEAVNPLVQGKARAEQFYRGDVAGEKVMSIIMHGDAAFAGQGVVYETFHLSELPDYTTHGTIHIVVNNQVGFTTDPRVARSSPYCTDVARVVNAPIFHVNGDDPEAVHHVCKVAAEWRAKFRKDVVIDLVGYRRYGHNELDEARFTQPVVCNKIDRQKPVMKQYAEQLIKAGVVEATIFDKAMEDYKISLDVDYQNAGKETHIKNEDWLDSPWPQSFFDSRDHVTIPSTGVDKALLAYISSKFAEEPQGFALHKGINRILNVRRELAGKEIADWAMAEALAWGSLLKEGIHVRLSGQDVERGTFSHRHHVLHDQERDKTTYRPLNHLWEKQAPYTVCNSSLSEYGVLGFDLGFSMNSPNALVMWEAQFGDFVNTAQCTIDQFVCSGYAKWRNQSGLVMLLPHGHEGMGPEHTSGQLERFLQLSSDSPDDFQSEAAQPSYIVDQLKRTNWQVMNLTTPANFFHAMRRQIALPFRRPLIIMTPKSLLKHAEARSTFDDMVVGTELKRIYPETGPASADPSAVTRLVFCSGKVFYELRKERDAKQLSGKIALVRVEQICPFPYDLVREELAKFPAAEVVWVQEEHQNRGAWQYVQPRVNNLLRLHMADPRQIRYIGRIASASPATGNKNQHLKEQAAVLSATMDIPNQIG
ncbi:2-oxoglutarate dehydrogenase, mitochondrial [Hypsibius exemplaris]|uniref:2-oxoglutarate dehydrogenase, mitochondrial n=1 Tax=Hypsibius exemplaris TaxID=2072580 RepID=A0A1W0WP17_HYPEX|nr:2-oxoglutarate dehydrogenase, mitochondrial [Hypsibius exemplaris]